MTDRLSDALVDTLSAWAADARPTTREIESLAREVQASRALIAAIDARHQPMDRRHWPYDVTVVCAGCHDEWPCLTHRLIHPEGSE